jgi:hypothetical protein
VQPLSDNTYPLSLEGEGQGEGEMNLIQKGINRFGKLIVASFFLMGIGLIVFLLTPLLYGLWGIDSDIPGMLVVILGLVLFLVGLILRKPTRVRRIIYIVLASILSLPILSAIITTIIYLITGQPLGE